jgi:hypothetical protein
VSRFPAANFAIFFHLNRGGGSRPQSRRRSADVLTINRPDAVLRKLLATKKQKKAKQPGLV